MRHEIYWQKYGVPEHKGAEYFNFLECFPSQKDFCFNSSVISLSWGTKCSMPLLPSSPARWTGSHLGRFSKLVPCRCSFAPEDHFFGAITGGWEALRCKGLLCQCPFSCEAPPCFSADVQAWKTLNAKVPIGQTGCGGATHRTDYCGLGAVWRPWPCWGDSLSGEVSVQPLGCLWCSILLAGWFFQACLKTNPSTWIKTCYFVSLFSPPSQLTRDNWEHKSLLI